MQQQQHGNASDAVAFHIRNTETADLPEVMDLYAHARSFMAEQGNPNQWGPSSWPPRELIEADIAADKSFVAQTPDGRIAAVFFYDAGQDIEPTYALISDGAWIGDGDYGVVHRIASAHIARGAGEACLRWALARSPHLRIDTHPDNIPMRSLVAKLGFKHCGTIYVYEDKLPRMAFEHLPSAICS